MMTKETDVLFYRDSVPYPKQPEDWQKRTQEYEAAAKRTGI